MISIPSIQQDGKQRKYEDSMLSYQAHSKPPRQRQTFHAVKNEVPHLYCFSLPVRVPLPHRGMGVKEKGARGRNQKREGRCESLGRALPSLLWCLPRWILCMVGHHHKCSKRMLTANAQSMQIVARGHHKRTGRSLTAVQGRLRSSPLPLKVPPSDPPP